MCKKNDKYKVWILFLKKVDLNRAVHILGEMWKDGENADR